MAEPAKTDCHVVEIPVSVDGGGGEEDAFLAKSSTAAAACDGHPLGEIAASAGHLLLLKLWQRDEARLCRRACALESRMDAARRDAFHLCAAFLAFHALSLTLLFASSASSASSVSSSAASAACRRWWAPTTLTLAASLALAAAVQLRVRAYWRAAAVMRRDRGDARALARAVQELRLKGAAFDLSKEPQYGAATARARCASVEGSGAANWAPVRWLRQNFVTVCLLAVAAVALPSGKFILCD